MSIEVRNVSKRFGDFVRRSTTSRSRSRRLADRTARPQRQRQVDAPPRHRGARDGPTPARSILAGEDVTALTPQKRGVGFVFQHYAAFKHMTVRDNVAFGLKIRKRPKAGDARARRRAARARAAAGVRRPLPRRSSPAGSGSAWRSPARSRRSRRCSCSTSRSARSTRASATELRVWLRRLHEETHMTTVFVTHDQEEAMEVADRIVVMNQGRVEQVGRAARALRLARQRVRDVVRRPGEPLRGRLGAPARPRARPRAERLDPRGAGRARGAPRVRGALSSSSATTARSSRCS